MFLNVIFVLSALLTLSATLALMITRNLIHACIFLLGTLLGVAGLYLSLGADFVAVTQVMVYVGGVVILLLFAVMLTGGKDSKESMSKSGFFLSPIMGNKLSYGLGIFTALIFLAASGKIFYHLFNVSHKAKAGEFTSTVEKIGELLIKEHILAFEISSVLLVGAFIGAAIIARPKKSSESLGK